MVPFIMECVKLQIINEILVTNMDTAKNGSGKGQRNSVGFLQIWRL